MEELDDLTDGNNWFIQGFRDGLNGMRSDVEEIRNQEMRRAGLSNLGVLKLEMNYAFGISIRLLKETFLVMFSPKTYREALKEAYISARESLRTTKKRKDNYGDSIGKDEFSKFRRMGPITDEEVANIKIDLYR